MRYAETHEQTAQSAEKVQRRYALLILREHIPSIYACSTTLRVPKHASSEGPVPHPGLRLVWNSCGLASLKPGAGARRLPHSQRPCLRCRYRQIVAIKKSCLPATLLRTDRTCSYSASTCLLLELVSRESGSTSSTTSGDRSHRLRVVPISVLVAAPLTAEGQLQAAAARDAGRQCRNHFRAPRWLPECGSPSVPFAGSTSNEP